MANKLEDGSFTRWCHAAAVWYGEDRVQAEALRPSEFSLHDVEYASDVASLIPVLYTFARYQQGVGRYRPSRSPVIVEIGTADGSTTLPLVKAMAELGGHLHSVDYSGCEDAHALVDKFGYRAHWTHHREFSDQFFGHFSGPLDFLFHDGDHRWVVVERDILNAYSRLSPGGILWLSDWDPLPVGFPSYDHEYDGPAFKEHVPGTVHDQQASRGVAKAVCKALPKLLGATVSVFPLWPNSSVLIRKTADGELGPGQLLQR